MDNPTFAELPLGQKLQAAIAAAGYTIPTPIQAQAIPIAVTGRDVLGIAQTGTGKTASFVLPMIERLETGRARARMPRSLILAPTRELAAQVGQSFEKYGINHKLNLALLIGGVSMDEQVKKLDRGADVLIATPGRMLDHYQRGRLMLMGVEILVIDEADRMLDMGFIPDIEKICKLLPPVRQTLFFSATMPNEIKRLVDTFLKDPVRVEVAPPATAAKTITQLFRFCPSSEDWEKREVLRHLIESNPVKNAIIFCNRKKDVAILHKSLTKHGFNAGALHGDMEQSARTATLDKFRNGEIALLAASDVAARGLDIPDVSHIFNFDIPWAGDDYVHRIGRTGRAGKEGTSFSIVTPDDLKLIKDIEKVTGEPPKWIGEAPTEEDFADAGKRRGRGGRRGAARPESRGGARGESRGGARGESRGGARGESRAGARGESRAGARGEGRGAARPEGGSAGRGEGREAPQGETPVAVSGDAVVAATGEARPSSPSAARPSRARPAGDRRDRERPRGRKGENRGEGRGERRPAQLTDAPAMGFAIDPSHVETESAEYSNGPAAVEPRRPPQAEAVQEPRRRPRPVQPVPGSGDQPFTDAPPRQRAVRQDRPARAESTRPARAESPREERPVAREPRQRRPEPAGTGTGTGNVGFADNVPAFLRRPVRPVKVTSS